MCTHAWERYDPAHSYKRICSTCGALGYRRGARSVAYRCNESGCKQPASQRSWRGTTEVHFCPEHSRCT